jgi:hypothetical protein
MISSNTAASPGINSQASPGKSCQSAHATGLRVTDSAGWYKNLRESVLWRKAADVPLGNGFGRNTLVGLKLWAKPTNISTAW